MKTESAINLEQNSRYEIRRVAVFDDDLASDGKRGIYEIIDTQTEKVYLGVSGIGITELTELNER